MVSNLSPSHLLKTHVIILSRAVLSDGTFYDSGHGHILSHAVYSHHSPLAFEHLKYRQQV